MGSLMVSESKRAERRQMSHDLLEERASRVQG